MKCDKCGWEGSDPIILEKSLICPECKVKLKALDYIEQFGLVLIRRFGLEPTVENIESFSDLITSFIGDNIMDIVDDFADKSAIYDELCDQAGSYKEAREDGRD